MHACTHVHSNDYTICYACSDRAKDRLEARIHKHTHMLTIHMVILPFLMLRRTPFNVKANTTIYNTLDYCIYNMYICGV